MFSIQNNQITSILNSMKNHGDVFIVGGFLRDSLLNLQPNDVDFKTNISVDTLKELFPSIKERETINGLKVFSFHRGGFDYEILPSDKKNETLNTFGDLTINSLAYDGHQLIDNYQALDDFHNKILRPVDLQLYKKHCLESPTLFLKAIRLSSTTGFTPDKELLDFLKAEKNILHSISNQIITNEAYKILEGKHTLNALKLLSNMNLIAHVEKNSFYEFPMLKKRTNLHFYLCFYALETSYDVVLDFIRLFHLPKALVEKFEELYQLVITDDYTSNYKLKNEITLLKNLKKIKPLI